MYLDAACPFIVRSQSSGSLHLNLLGGSVFSWVLMSKAKCLSVLMKLPDNCMPQSLKGLGPETQMY